MLKKTTLLLAVAIILSLFLHLYKINEIPPCLNADEAAFGYNSYSILKTGRDEYGAFMPLRFKSFLDYKLPLYSYLSIPFIWTFGLNEFSTRALNILIGVLFVPLIYFITKELFENEKIATLAAFLIALNPGIYILSRHAHEGVIAAFFILNMFYFLLKFFKTKKTIFFILGNIFLMLTSFSYQSGRLYLFFFFVYQLIIILQDFFSKHKLQISKLIFLFLIAFIALFFDFKYGLNRVSNLLFFKDPGFAAKLTEYLGEHPNRIVHNKLVESVREITNKYFDQLSPQFLIISGDGNWRFGLKNLGIFTPVEYLILFMGFYFLFKNKARLRYFLLFFLFITPFNNALTRQDPSLIRAYPLLFPMVIIIAYGFYNFSSSFKNIKSKLILMSIIFLAFVFFKYGNFDIYFNHYPKRAVVARAWQCGYKELVEYVRQNYNKYDRFVITDRHGQPYIYFLYYMQYDPASYQKQAKISASDKYGFGQIGEFDKYTFKFKFDKKAKRTSYIGYPDEINGEHIDSSSVKKIKVGNEEMFWIYEVN